MYFSVYCCLLCVLCRWTPKGQLVAHIHEHKDSINRYIHTYNSSPFSVCYFLLSIETHIYVVEPVSVCCRVRVLPDSSVFATFSSDGTAKLWDVQKLEGRNLINKAKLSYSQLGQNNHTQIICVQCVLCMLCVVL